MNEPKCGSGALIPTHACKNFIPKSALDCAYRVFRRPSTLDNVLVTSGLKAWRTFRLDIQEETTTPPSTLPRFGTRTGPTLPRPTAHTPRRDYSTRKGPSPQHPGCQRGNNWLHTREGHGFPRADHIIATNPPVLLQHLYRAQKEGRQISTCNDTRTRALYPPFVKDPVGGGTGSKRGISVRHPLPPHVYIIMGPSKVLNEPKCGSRALIPTHVC